MRIIMYGNQEPKYPVYLQKQLANDSNGSATQIKWLTTKQFDKASKKFEKQLQKRKNKK